MTRTTTDISSSATPPRRSVWGRELPAPIKKLECSLTSAFSAADDVADLSYAHRVRMYDDIASAITDAACASARSGYAAWALHVIDAAAERPPRWAAGYAEDFWTRLIDSGRDAILSTLSAAPLNPAPLHPASPKGSGGAA